MSFFQRIFKSKSSEKQSFFPDISTVSISLSGIKKQRLCLERFVLEERLAKLTQTRPKREAELWQGLENEEPDV